jgi:hypothetical protein
MQRRILLALKHTPGEIEIGELAVNIDPEVTPDRKTIRNHVAALAKRTPPLVDYDRARGVVERNAAGVAAIADWHPSEEKSDTTP